MLDLYSAEVGSRSRVSEKRGTRRSTVIKRTFFNLSHYMATETKNNSVQLEVRKKNRPPEIKLSLKVKLSRTLEKVIFQLPSYHLV